MNSFDWKDVQIHLNGSVISNGFTSAKLGVLQAGGSLTIPFGEIYSTDGRRFDRTQQACLAVSVMAWDQSDRMGVYTFKNDSGAPIDGVATRPR